MSSDAWLNDRDANSLDFLRVLAAGLVILGHSFAFVGGKDPLFTWSGSESLGLLGVDIFFFMSGMLVTRSWLTVPSAPAFLTKRVLRIYPGLAVAVLFCVLIVGPLGTVLFPWQYFADAGTYAFLLNALVPGHTYFLPGAFSFNPIQAANGSLWTLPYELLCYVGVLLAGKSRLLTMKAFPLLAAAVVGYVLGSAAFSDDAKPGNFVLQALLGGGRCYLHFLLGAAVCVYGRFLPVNRWLALLVAALCIGTFSTGLVGTIAGFFGYPYLALFAAQSRVAWLSHWGKHGDLSYGMYIYAFPLQQLVVHYFGVGIGATGVCGLSLLFIVPMAYLSWHKVEQPALAFGRRLLRKRASCPPVVYAQAAV